MEDKRDFLDKIEYFVQSSDVVFGNNHIINDGSDIGIILDTRSLNVNDCEIECNNIRNKFQEINQKYLMNNSIYVGVEVDFDIFKFSQIEDVNKIVDFVVLNERKVTKNIDTISPINNPYYPIEYANSLLLAMETRLFDIITNPDYYMKFRNTISEENKKLYDKNCIIAQNMICRCAKESNTILEVNLDSNVDDVYDDGKLSFPHPSFWETASNHDVKVIVNQNVRFCLSEERNCIFEIINLIKDNVIKSNIVMSIVDQEVSDDYNYFSSESYLFKYIIEDVLNKEPNIDNLKNNFKFKLNELLEFYIGDSQDKSDTLNNVVNFKSFIIKCENVMSRFNLDNCDTRDIFVNYMMLLMELESTKNENKINKIRLSLKKIEDTNNLGV